MAKLGLFCARVFFVFFFFLFLSPASVYAQTAITLDPQTTYQMMNGWEVTSYANHMAPEYQDYKDDLIHKLANDYRANRVRLEIRSGVENIIDYWTEYVINQSIPYDLKDANGNRICPSDPNDIRWRYIRYATVNDNDNAFWLEPDPDAPNDDSRFKGFHFAELDSKLDNVILPLKNAIEANNEKLHINMNYVAFTSQICAIYGPDPRYIIDTYHHTIVDPTGAFEEYAEFIEATFLHMQRKYGFYPDTLEILLEPENVSQWGGRELGKALVAVANRLNSHGMNPRFVAPSTTDRDNAPSYFDLMVDEVTSLNGDNAYIGQYLEELSYHRYRTPDPSSIAPIVSRANQFQIHTSMLECWTNAGCSNHYRVLLDDMVNLFNSAWQEATMLGVYSYPGSGSLVTINDQSKLIRQYTKYVRCGAVRIKTSSSSTSVQPVAFKRADGKNDDNYTVVLAESNGNGATYHIQNLPSGGYKAFYTTHSSCTNYRSVAEYDVVLDEQTITNGQELTVAIPKCGVLTVYNTSNVIDPPHDGGLEPDADNWPGDDGVSNDTGLMEEEANWPEAGGNDGSSSVDKTHLDDIDAGIVPGTDRPESQNAQNNGVNGGCACGTTNSQVDPSMLAGLLLWVLFRSRRKEKT